MADTLITQEKFYNRYKERLTFYVRALYYDDHRQESELHNNFSVACHNLHRHIITEYYQTGVTEVMVEKMYGSFRGGDFHELPGRSYISLRKPEIRELHTIAEAAREKYNIFTWNQLTNYLDRIFDTEIVIKLSNFPSSLKEKAHNFFALEERIRELKNSNSWEVCENGEKYFYWDNSERYSRELSKFKREHPGYAEEIEEAQRKDFDYHRRHGRVAACDTLTHKVNLAYGWEAPTPERTLIKRAIDVYYDIVKWRERATYDKQQSLGNLENLYRGILQAMREIYPGMNDAEIERFWRKHFDLPFYFYSDKKPAPKPKPKPEPKPEPKPAPAPAPKPAPKPAPAPKPKPEPKPAPPPPPIHTNQSSLAPKSDFKVSGSLLRKYAGTAPGVVLPNGIKRIWETAFEDARDHITSVVIPEGVTELVRFTFKDCVKLERVTLPSTLTSIEFNAFEGCQSLREINFPSRLSYIGSSAFCGCTSLKSVKLPKDCTISETEFSPSFPKTCKVTKG